MIISLNNNLIKSIAKLSCKKERQKRRLFIAEGLRVCTTLIDDGFALEYLLVSNENISFFDHYSLTIISKIIVVSDAIIRKISNLTNPSGIIGIFRMKDEVIQPIIDGLILYNLQDPGNVGTLIRSCAAMNKRTVIFIESVEPYHPKVVQAAAGSFAHINFMECTWQQLLYKKNNNRFKIGALVVKGGKNPQMIDFEHMLLMVGNEAHGIPQEIVNQCDEPISLYMPGGTESLNAAIAGSIALYLSVKA